MAFRPAYVWLLAAVAVTTLSTGPLLAETRFTIVSGTSGTWVARGLSYYNVTDANGWNFTAQTNPAKSWVSIDLSGPGLPAAPSVDYWSFDFEAPNNGVLEPGTYEDATRYPFNSTSVPGMAFSSTGRGDNTLLADFIIREFTYGPGNTVNSFAVDFTYYGEGRLHQPVVGEIRFNSIPEPCSAAMLAIASGVGLGIRRRR